MRHYRFKRLRAEVHGCTLHDYALWCESCCGVWAILRDGELPIRTAVYTEACPEHEGGRLIPDHLYYHYPSELFLEHFPQLAIVDDLIARLRSL